MNRKDMNRVMFAMDACREELALLEELDALVKAATLGDRDAVGAILIAFGPTLLDEARAVLGEQWAQEAGDVLQQLSEALMGGELCFRPRRGRALRFLRGAVRSIARRLVKRRELARENEEL